MTLFIRLVSACLLLLVAAPVQVFLEQVMRTIRIFSVGLLLLAAMPRQLVFAQELASSTKPAADELEALRRQLEQLAAQVNQLQQTVQTQAELISQQRDQLQTLQQKVTSNPTLTAAQALNPASTTTQPASATQVEPLAARAEVGYGKVTIDGLFQGWYAAGNSGFRDTFRLRRAEFTLNGQLMPKVKYRILFNLAKTLNLNNTPTTIGGNRVLSNVGIDLSSHILDDAYVSFEYLKNAQVRVGQIRVPLSLEGLQSSAALDTVERALFLSDGARGGRLGYVWDRGVTLNGNLTQFADYQVGVFNGTGESWNDVDHNDQKALSGRLAAHPPFIKGLQLGSSGAWSNGRGGDHPRHDRLGGDVLYVRGPLKFKTEVMTAKDADLPRLGYYTHLGYKITPRVEAIFRFDSYDPDRRRETSATDVTEHDYVTGFNYFIHENRLKLQFNYLRKTFEHSITPSSNLVLVNLQTSW
jgi:phosphate-selective porin